MLTSLVLNRIYKMRSKAALEPYMEALNAAMKEFEINTPLRQAAFLAQVGHESCQFKYFEEIADGSAYEGRKDLGNTQPGDGKLFKGRGPIQLTGRNNYAKASKDLGVDLIASPKRAADLDVGFRIAGWFWKKNGLNELADSKSFDAITKKINGGLNGKKERDVLYSLATLALVP